MILKSATTLVDIMIGITSVDDMFGMVALCTTVNSLYVSLGILWPVALVIFSPATNSRAKSKGEFFLLKDYCKIIKSWLTCHLFLVMVG